MSSSTTFDHRFLPPPERAFPSTTIPVTFLIQPSLLSTWPYHLINQFKRNCSSRSGIFSLFSNKLEFTWSFNLTPQIHLIIDLSVRNKKWLVWFFPDAFLFVGLIFRVLGRFFYQNPEWLLDSVCPLPPSFYSHFLIRSLDDVRDYREAVIDVKLEPAIDIPGNMTEERQKVVDNYKNSVLKLLNIKPLAPSTWSVFPVVFVAFFFLFIE